MKNSIYILCFLSITACKKNNDPACIVQQGTSYSVIGTWITTSANYKYYEDGVLFIDSTVYSPYNGMVDIIETVRFTATDVFLKMNNDSSEGEFYQYNRSGKYIICTDEGDTDTLFTINNLTSSAFDFTLDYTYDTTGGEPLIRVIGFYKSIKQ